MPPFYYVSTEKRWFQATVILWNKARIGDCCWWLMPGGYDNSHSCNASDNSCFAVICWTWHQRAAFVPKSTCLAPLTMTSPSTGSYKTLITWVLFRPCGVWTRSFLVTYTRIWPQVPTYRIDSIVSRTKNRVKRLMWAAFDCKPHKILKKIFISGGLQSNKYGIRI